MYVNSFMKKIISSAWKIIVNRYVLEESCLIRQLYELFAVANMQDRNEEKKIEQCTMVLIKIECIIKYYPFECTFIWTNIIKQLWKVKKMVMVRLKLQDILWFINEHPLKCKKTLNRQALVDNFLRPSTLLLWKFLIF